MGTGLCGVAVAGSERDQSRDLPHPAWEEGEFRENWAQIGAPCDCTAAKPSRMGNEGSPGNEGFPGDEGHKS